MILPTAKRFRSSRDFGNFASHQFQHKSLRRVQFTTKIEPTPNDSLVLDKTRYQRNAVVQPLAAQLARERATRFWHNGNVVGPFRLPTPHATRAAIRRDQRGRVVRTPSPAGYCLAPTAKFPRPKGARSQRSSS